MTIIKISFSRYEERARFQENSQNIHVLFPHLPASVDFAGHPHDTFGKVGIEIAMPRSITFYTLREQIVTRLSEQRAMA